MLAPAAGLIGDAQLQAEADRCWRQRERKRERDGKGCGNGWNRHTAIVTAGMDIIAACSVNLLASRSARRVSFPP